MFHHRPYHPQRTRANPPPTLATSLATLADLHDDRHLSRLAAIAVGTAADLHAICEMLAGVAGVPDSASGVTG